MSDLKITRRHTSSSGLSSEDTTYIKTDRKRLEYRNQLGSRPGPRLANITRCDLGKAFELNLDFREYTAGPFPMHPTLEELRALAAKIPRPAKPPEPTVIVETTTVDSGERKQFFGFTARHVITTRKEHPLKGSRRKPSEQVTDGWYIDLDTRISCDPNYPSGGHAFLTVRTVGKPEIPEIPEFRDIGQPETGYPVDLKTTTTFPPNGKVQERASTMEDKIIELSAAPLDPALFEVPPRFKQVAQIARNPQPPFSMRLLSAWAYWKSRFLNLFRRTA